MVVAAGAVVVMLLFLLLILLLLMESCLWAAEVWATTLLFPKAGGRGWGRSSGSERPTLAAPPRLGAVVGGAGSGCCQRSLSPPPQSFWPDISDTTEGHLSAFKSENRMEFIDKQLWVTEEGMMGRRVCFKWRLEKKESHTHLLSLTWKLFPKDFW